jgi:hypothetical protein
VKRVRGSGAAAKLRERRLLLDQTLEIGLELNEQITSGLEHDAKSPARTRPNGL